MPIPSEFYVPHIKKKKIGMRVRIRSCLKKEKENGKSKSNESVAEQIPNPKTKITKTQNPNHKKRCHSLLHSKSHRRNIVSGRFIEVATSPPFLLLRESTPTAACLHAAGHCRCSLLTAPFIESSLLELEIAAFSV